ncbi:MAG: hypothetical protein WA709_31585 [Stellaceae bacterium]
MKIFEYNSLQDYPSTLVVEFSGRSAVPSVLYPFPALVRALRDARGSSPWTPWTILCRLDRHHPFYATVFVSTAQIAATLTPTQSAASRRDQVPLLLCRSPFDNNVSRWRFDANLWDPSLLPAESAGRANRPIGFEMHPQPV